MNLKEYGLIQKAYNFFKNRNYQKLSLLIDTEYPELFYLPFFTIPLIFLKHKRVIHVDSFFFELSSLISALKSICLNCK